MPPMRQLLACALIATLLTPAATAQSLDKELVASLSGPALGQGVVSELLWDGGTLIVQSAAVQPDGQLMPRYFAAPAANMELQRLEAAPASAERYWKMKSSRVSPTRLGTITAGRDSAMPMLGVGTQENRLLNAAELGGMDITHELHLGKTLIHRRKALSRRTTARCGRGPGRSSIGSPTWTRKAICGSRAPTASAPSAFCAAPSRCPHGQRMAASSP